MEAALPCAWLPQSCCPTARRRCRPLLLVAFCCALAAAVAAALIAQALQAPPETERPSSCGVARNSTTTCGETQVIHDLRRSFHIFSPFLCLFYVGLGLDLGVPRTVEAFPGASRARISSTAERVTSRWTLQTPWRLLGPSSKQLGQDCCGGCDEVAECQAFRMGFVVFLAAKGVDIRARGQAPEALERFWLGLAQVAAGSASKTRSAIGIQVT